VRPGDVERAPSRYSPSGDLNVSTAANTEGPETVRGFLARVRGVLYRHEAVRAAMWALAICGGVALVVPLLGHVVADSRASALSVLSIGGVIALTVVVTALFTGIFAPRRRYSEDTELARWVGTRKRDVASDLLSAVELTQAKSKVGAPSKDLVAALIEQIETRIAKIAPRSLLPADEMPRARRWLIIAFVLNGLALVIMPHVIAAGWRSLVHAPPSPYDGATLSSVPLVGDLEATLTFPAYAKRPPLPLPSSSGDFRGLPGTTVDVRAKVLVPAAEVELIVEGQVAPIVATLDKDQITAKLFIDKSTTYRFAVRSPTGGRAIETTPRAIEAEPDQTPVVQLLAPAESLDVTNLRRVELAYTIEDDYGVVSAELIWESGKDHGKKAIQFEPGARTSGKILWDIAEISVPSGGEVRYWLEAKDNDNIRGPNIGKSKELRLKVVSPRERHEETLGRHAELAEKIIRNLGQRLAMPADDTQKEVARAEVVEKLREAIVELGSLVAAYDKDPHASDAMRKSLGGMRDRLDKATTKEHALMPTKTGVKMLPNRFSLLDPPMIRELEDDTIALADWLDRERMEGMLDISDEIAAHQKRLQELMQKYEKTKDPRLLDEIEREMKALDRAFSELEKHRQGMPEDVLDQYVHRDAMEAQQSETCMDEVRKLVHAGDIAKADLKLAQCRAMHDKASQSLEGSLSDLRGDKFNDEQKKLDEVLGELADVKKDQEDIAADANKMFEQYAEKADELAKEHRREASKKVGALVDKLRNRINGINQQGLTPFAKEEMDIVQRRLDDTEKMVADGDLAEALGMARQAQSSLDTIAEELEAAVNDDPKSKWADATQDALDGVNKSSPIAKELIKELQGLAPKPDEIMSPDDLRAMDRLRRRQSMNKARTQKLAERTKQLGGDLPGDAAETITKQLGNSIEHMGNAEDRMKTKDPSGAREEARSAADSLNKAQDRAKSAARQAQQGAINDEPIKIPGADEYKAPEQFRQQLLDAMKKGGKVDGYEEQNRRYYEELAK
jgi:hypothetical protein